MLLVPVPGLCFLVFLSNFQRCESRRESATSSAHPLSQLTVSQARTTQQQCSVETHSEWTTDPYSVLQDEDQSDVPWWTFGEVLGKVVVSCLAVLVLASLTIVGKRASVCGYGKDCASALRGSGARGVLRHAFHLAQNLRAQATRPQAFQNQAVHHTQKLDTLLMSPTESFTAEFVARDKAVYWFSQISRISQELRIAGVTLHKKSELSAHQMAPLGHLRTSPPQ